MEDWSSAAHAVRQQPRKGCEQENCINHATQTSTASRPTFFPGAEMGGTEEPCYEINPVMFCADDENCGHVHTDIVDVYEEMPCDGEREY